MLLVTVKLTDCNSRATRGPNRRIFAIVMQASLIGLLGNTSKNTQGSRTGGLLFVTNDQQMIDVAGVSDVFEAFLCMVTNSRESCAHLGFRVHLLHCIVMQRKL
jgi:hypothetical protein